MALIKYPECGKEISDQAGACPSCARPLQDVRTIEATGKTWKGLKITAVILFFVGLFVYNASTNSDGSPFGAFLMIGLVFLYITAGIFAWWHHG